MTNIHSKFEVCYQNFPPPHLSHQKACQLVRSHMRRIGMRSRPGEKCGEDWEVYWCYQTNNWACRIGSNQKDLFRGDLIGRKAMSGQHLPDWNHAELEKRIGLTCDVVVANFDKLKNSMVIDENGEPQFDIAAILKLLGRPKDRL